MPDQVAWDYPHISDAEPLSSNDGALIADLHDVLQRHGALKRFGITLLHTHFPLAADEVILEETDMDTRLQTMRPVPLASVEGIPATETSWSLETGRAIMRCTCLKSGKDHIHGETN